jgi:hypothetical protein
MEEVGGELWWRLCWRSDVREEDRWEQLANRYAVFESDCGEGGDGEGGDGTGRRDRKLILTTGVMSVRVGGVASWGCDEELIRRRVEVLVPFALCRVVWGPGAGGRWFDL